jgi:hypothetical protein
MDDATGAITPAYAMPGRIFISAAIAQAARVLKEHKK